MICDYAQIMSVLSSIQWEWTNEWWQGFGELAEVQITERVLSRTTYIVKNCFEGSLYHLDNLPAFVEINLDVSSVTTENFDAFPFESAEYELRFEKYKKISAEFWGDPDFCGRSEDCTDTYEQEAIQMAVWIHTSARFMLQLKYEDTEPLIRICLVFEPL